MHGRRCQGAHFLVLITYGDAECVRRAMQVRFMQTPLNDPGMRAFFAAAAAVAAAATAAPQPAAAA